MKKWLIIGAAVLALLGVALVVTYRALLSRDFLVERIEASINSRVQVGDLGVSLFSVPAKVVIRDVILADRDDAARQGVPHDERAKLEEGRIRIEEIRFDLSLRDLISKQIKVSELKLAGAHFEMVMNEAGELDIEELFAAPPDKPRKDKAKQDKAGGGADFVTELERLLIKDASFTLRIEKTGLEVVGDGVKLDLSDIRVDPSALEKVNEAKLEFAAKLEAFSTSKGRLKYGQLGLEGPARVRLFDPATGALAPDAEIEFAIHPDSHVSSKAPYLKKLWEVTDTLVKIGLKAEPLPDRLTFGRERVLSASYSRNRIDLRKPVSLQMEDWELVLDGGSWVELGTEQHRSSVWLIAGEKVSGFVAGHLAKLTEIAPAEARAGLQAELLGKVFVDDRLTLQVATHGPLSDPKAKLQTQLPDAEKLLKDYAKNKAMDFLLRKLAE